MSVLALPVARAADESIRIGTVDMQKAIQSVDAGRKAKAQLEKEIEGKKKQIQDEQNALKKMDDEFKKQSLVMSDEARAKKQAQLQERFMKYQELAQRSQAELQQKEAQLTEPIVTKLRGIIQSLAKDKKYTVVLEKNENTVLFSQEKDDMTDEVIQAFNKQNKG